MGTSVYFGGKIRKLPGTYGTVKSGIKSEANLSNYNNILLIDAGAGTGFNSSIGLNDRGKDGILHLTKDEANGVIKGGALAPVIKALFSPAVGANGVGTLHFIKASTSTPASISSVTAYGGAITATTITTKEEGAICNTTLVSGVLRKGYLLKCCFDSTQDKGYVEVWEGTYEGVNGGGYPINNLESLSYPTCIFRSKKFSKPSSLVAYLKSSKDFNNLFTVVGLTSIEGDVFTTKTTTSLSFAGGADTYATNLGEIFPLIKDLDYSFVICLEAADAQTLAPSVFNFLTEETNGLKHLLTFSADGETAKTLAAYYNADYVVCVAKKIKETSTLVTDGFIIHDAMVSAAYVLGRIVGLSPEVPATLKSIDIDGVEEEPSEEELEEYLDAGVICPHYDSDLDVYCLSQAVNTLQANSRQINLDATTFSVQVKRIICQVLKNLVQQSKIEFWGGEVAVNKGTLSPAYIKGWTEGKLSKMSLSKDKTENNYLLSYEVTQIVEEEDNIYVEFNFTVNGEINKIFFTGVILG